MIPSEPPAVSLAFSPGADEKPEVWGTANDPSLQALVRKGIGRLGRGEREEKRHKRSVAGWPKGVCLLNV